MHAGLSTSAAPQRRQVITPIPASGKGAAIAVCSPTPEFLHDRLDMRKLSLCGLRIASCTYRRSGSVTPMPTNDRW